MLYYANDASNLNWKFHCMVFVTVEDCNRNAVGLSVSRSLVLTLMGFFSTTYVMSKHLVNLNMNRIWMLHYAICNCAQKIDAESVNAKKSPDQQRTKNSIAWI